MRIYLCVCVYANAANTFFFVFQTHKATDSAVSLLKSANKSLVDAIVLLVCEKF